MSKLSAVADGFFATTLQFENLEIHKVCLRFPNFDLSQNLTTAILANLFIVYLYEVLPDFNDFINCGKYSPFAVIVKNGYSIPIGKFSGFHLVSIEIAKTRNPKTVVVQRL